MVSNFLIHLDQRLIVDSLVIEPKPVTNHVSVDALHKRLKQRQRPHKQAAVSVQMAVAEEDRQYSRD